MFIIKRSGKKESFDDKKIIKRINKLTAGLEIEDDVIKDLETEVKLDCYENIETREIDKKLIDVLKKHIKDSEVISDLYARSLVTHIHRNTENKFSDFMNELVKVQEISKEEGEWILSNKDKLNSIIIEDRDFEFDCEMVDNIVHFLTKDVSGPIERIQFFLLRNIIKNNNYSDLDKIVSEYNEISSSKELIKSKFKI